MIQLLESVPFIGKHKRVIGGLLMAAGAMLGALGVQPELGDQLRTLGEIVLGLGVVHAAAKARR